ncbi:MAG TPA: ABC transporter permease [Candidatus Acidoferrales bacterium]|nr:ABC transporter permease [Candidatus Acidoferrales bacterium]
MNLLSSLRTFASGLFRRSRVESEMDEELRAHIDNRAKDLERTGVSRAEAERRARIEFGGYQKFKEECREAVGVHFFETLIQDLRYALRMLRKSPGFTTVAVLTLALGIGANTAIFSLLDGLVLRNLPVPHPEQLVHVAAYAPDNSDSGLSLPMFEEIARDQRVFSSMFAWEGEGVFNVEINGSLSRGDVWPIDGNFYANLGAVPEIGRLIGPQDVDANSATPTPVAVLGYDYWRLHFGGDPSVIGKTIKIEEVPFTIIGVTRSGFAGMTADIPFEIAVPFTTEPLIEGHADVQKHLQRRDGLWYDAAGRLKPGVTLEQARAQLDSLWPAIRAATMPTSPEQRARFLSLQLKLVSDSTGSSYVRGRFSAPLYLLLGISGLVLLIACVNLASLMLARAAARGHELGLRVALGASRWRLARQMLTESLMLSVVGALAGLALAFWGSKTLSNFIFAETYIVPGALNLTPDVRVLGFAAAVAILTGVLFGSAHALRLSAVDPNAALQLSSRTVGRGTGRLGKGLILTQIALSLVLLASAGLFIRSLEKLHEVDPGFRAQGLLDADLYPNPGGYKNLNWASYERQLTDQIASLPGVESVGISHLSPGGGNAWSEQVAPSSSRESTAEANCALALPGFFRTMGIGLLRGRSFTWQDDDHASHVAVVSESLARMLFPAADAIGQEIHFPNRPQWKDIQIVGIVSNASVYNIRKHAPPTVYLASIQYGDYAGWSQLIVRTSVAPARVESSIRKAVESLGHEYVPAIRTVAATIDRSLLQERITAMLSVFFGGLALLLAAIGLYGLMAYNVTRRTRELGVRLALGAQRASVLWMILRETLTLAVIGVVIGVPSALAATRLIAHMLFGVTPYDPVTLAITTIALLAVAAIAGCVPARRAMRVDPMVALRYE